MRRNILNNIMLVSLLTLAGCSNETDIVSTQSTDKTPISLSVGVESASTRAVTTDGTGKTLVALPENTNIWMAMKSEKTDASPMYCSTIGTTATANASNENPIKFTSDNTRFWDDAYGKDASLSVWALTVPSASSVPGSKSAASWSDTENTLTIDWSLTSAQTAATVAAEDLCFSNNIAASNMKCTDGKFDQGKLIFYHALTKVTFKLVPGDGFKGDGTDFKFDGTSTEAYAPIYVKGFKLSGTFDVTSGEFTSQATSAKEITSMSKTTPDAGNENGYTLEALVMPGRSFTDDTTTDAVSFSIDGNSYKVSATTLMTQLRAGNAGETWTIMEPGKNYVFTFRISKTGIKVTATVASWIDVEADTYEPKITIDKCYGQETNSNDFGKAFSLYLSEQVNAAYEKKADVSATYTLTPQLYWPNHSTHYFFRGIWPEVKAEGTPSEKVSNSAITVENGAYSANTYPSDLMLGYPRKADGTADETCKVHTSPVTQGICADEHNIHMNFQYVMSQVEVKLSTSTGDDKVVLDNNTTIEILGGYKSGSIKLEDGSAAYTESDKGTYQLLGGITANNYDRHDVIIPQSLANLKFKITVQDADGHKDSYEATIADIDVTPTGGTKGKISSWLPGKKYIYSLYITKTGIKITATLKDWETVTSDNNHIWM